MKHELSLTPEFIQASRSCQGDTSRLRKFLQKLLRGEAVSVATIGGSVTGTPWLLKHLFGQSFDTTQALLVS